MYLLFVTSLTWYIFTRFGGVQLNRDGTAADGQATTTNRTGPDKNVTREFKFCKQPRWENNFVKDKSIRDCDAGPRCDRHDGICYRFYDELHQYCIKHYVTEIKVISSNLYIESKMVPRLDSGLAFSWWRPSSSWSTPCGTLSGKLQGLRGSTG